jgi:hypothetical protein
MVSKGDNTMKAMMSTGSKRPAYRATMGFDRESALSEARAILAVSEPPQKVAPFPKTWERHAKAYLAESLSAFVEAGQ